MSCFRHGFSATRHPLHAPRAATAPIQSAEGAGSRALPGRRPPGGPGATIVLSHLAARVDRGGERALARPMHATCCRAVPRCAGALPRQRQLRAAPRM
jgi:hypothetical protein